MSRSIVLPLCFVGLSLLWWQTGARAQDAPAPQDSQQAFYTWLDKYSDPKFELKSENHSSDLKADSNSDKPWYSRGYRAVNALAAWARSLWTNLPPEREIASGNREEGEGPSEVSHNSASDSGLGCFYHRDYYTHLPMFKGNNYTLPGSFAASEAYQEEFSGSFSSAIASPTGETQTR